MERHRILDEIKSKLAVFQAEVWIANENGEYDINRHSENMLIPILNKVIDASFQNMNVMKHNFPAIDLGDCNKRICVQITSTGTSTKVSHTLEEFNKHELGELYSELWFYFLQEPSKKISLTGDSMKKKLGTLSADTVRFLSNASLYKKVSDSTDISIRECVFDILKKEFPDINNNRANTAALTPLPSWDHEVGLVGREDIKETIKNALLYHESRIVLCGFEGIGKTALASKICQEIKNEQTASTAWIVYSGDLRKDLLALELYTELGSLPEMDANERQNRILTYLKTTTDPICIFIDIVSVRMKQTDIKLINQFANSVRIIITARYRIYEFKCVSIKPLMRDDAICMYEKYRRKPILVDEEKLFDELLIQTSSNTLLIELLAKYAQINSLTLRELVSLIESKGIWALGTTKIQTIYSRGRLLIQEFVKRIYSISDLSGEQERIMKLLAIIPAEVSVSEKMIDWAGLDKGALRELVEGGWVKCTNHAGGEEDIRITLSAVVRDVVLSGDTSVIDFNHYKRLVEMVCEASNYYMRSNPPVFGERADIVIPKSVADYRLSHFKESAREDSVTAKICGYLSIVYKRNGDLSNAEYYAKKSLYLCKRCYGERSKDAAKALSQYAEILSEHRKDEKAEKLAKKALEIRKSMGEKDRSAEASSYDLLGRIHIKSEEYEEAVKNLQEALKIRKDKNPKETDTAKTLHNLGRAYGGLGNYDEAIKTLKSALSIRKNKFGNKHHLVAATYSRIGDMYRMKGDVHKAIESYVEAQKIFEALSMSHHSIAESTYWGLGKCYEKLDKDTDAKNAYKSAHIICLREYGADNPKTKEAEKKSM